MSEEGTKRSRARRRMPAILAALALGVAGVAWAGCGDDDGETVDAGEVQTQIEQGVEEATEGVEKGVDEAKQGIEEGQEKAREGIEKGTEEAEKGIEKGKEEAQKGIEEGEKYEDRYSP
jgi:hypothetical protein